jgi:FkbM family methyltransferase
MAGSYVTRLAARARQALGITELTERVAALDARLAQTRPPTPAGPLYFGDHTALLSTRWGGRMLVDTRDAAMAPWLVLDGSWEPQVTGWLQETLTPGMVFVDVGANVGYFTLLGAGLVGPSGTVVAVEAHPRLAGILQRNVVLNGYHGWVTVHQRAAWSERTSLEFHMRDHFTSSSSLGRIDDAGLSRLGDTVQSVTVEAVTLDDLLEGLPRVDVLKIDIEGAEAHAFAGLRHTLEANPHAVVMFEWGRSLIESVGDKPEQLTSVVDSFGFKLRLLETGEPITSDDLLGLPYGNVLAHR